MSDFIKFEEREPDKFEDIQVIINKIEHINIEINRQQREYIKYKFDYDMKFLNLKYSDNYKQYKTIKEKEERAQLELGMEKQIYKNTGARLEELKQDKEVLLLWYRYCMMKWNIV